MRDLNYELAPKTGMLASQRKAELDAARFVAVRNLAYMIYKKPDGSALMTYQETLDNRELVKAAIINFEIMESLVQNDLGSTTVPPSQSQQMVPTNNGAQMPQQPMPPMQFQPQPQQTQQPMPAQQFAQVPMQPQQPQFAPQQPQFAPQAQMMPMQPQQQYTAPQQMSMQPQMAPAAPHMEAAPVTGKKKRPAAGNAVAPPPPANGQMVAPPGFQPQAIPAQQAAVQVQQFGPPLAAPQPQFTQQVAQQAPQGDLGGLLAKIDILGKGVEVAANNGDLALKTVSKLQADMDELKTISFQILTAIHHMYISIQGSGGQTLLLQATEGKASTLKGFQDYLQKYIGNPK